MCSECEMLVVKQVIMSRVELCSWQCIYAVIILHVIVQLCSGRKCRVRYNDSVRMEKSDYFVVREASSSG